MQRKKPFSHKQKKQQLKAKREKEREKEEREKHGGKLPTKNKPRKQLDSDDDGELDADTQQLPISTKTTRSQKLPASGARGNRGGRGGRAILTNEKLRTVFEVETREIIERRKLEAQQPIQRKPRVASESLYAEVIDMPKRPPWDSTTTKEQLEANERGYFEKWLRDIYERYPAERLNYFEHNLEVWRQLWRVVERSDILMFVSDIRYPTLHFPPSLYHYVTEDHKKPMVLVLNKTDLVPQSVLSKWVDYFHDKYPLLKVVPFTCHPNADGLGTLPEDQQITEKRKVSAGRHRMRKRYAAVGVAELLAEIQRLAAEFKERQRVELDLASLRAHTSPSEADDISDDASDDDSDDSSVQSRPSSVLEDDDYAHHAQHMHAFITVGAVGQPNVGKSSLINALMGRKVVSTSRTPGHTKHLQTVFLTPQVRLCDCPGLVFPAVGVPRPLQVVAGLFPLAQCREPYTAIRYLAERVPVEEVYGLDLAAVAKETATPNDGVWSAWRICEAYALKKGYRTTKGGLDTYRAAQEILKDTLDGRVLLYFEPPLPGVVDAEEITNASENKRDNTKRKEKHGAEVHDEGSDSGEIEEEEEEEEQESSDEEEKEKVVGSKRGVRSANMFAVLGDE